MGVKGNSDNVTEYYVFLGSRPLEGISSKQEKYDEKVSAITTIEQENSSPASEGVKCRPISAVDTNDYSKAGPTSADSLELSTIIKDESKERIDFATSTKEETKEMLVCTSNNKDSTEGSVSSTSSKGQPNSRPVSAKDTILIVNTIDEPVIRTEGQSIERPVSATYISKDDSSEGSSHNEKDRPTSAASSKISVSSASSKEESKQPEKIENINDQQDLDVTQSVITKMNKEQTLPHENEELKDNEYDNIQKNLRPKTAAFLRRNTASDNFDEPSDDECDDKHELKQEMSEADDTKLIFPKIREAFDLYDNEGRGFVPTSCIGNIMRSSGF